MKNIESFNNMNKIKEFNVDIPDGNSEHNLIPFKILIHTEYIKKMIEIGGLESTLKFAQEYIRDAIITTIDPNHNENDLAVRTREDVVNNILKL